MIGRPSTEPFRDPDNPRETALVRSNALQALSYDAVVFVQTAVSPLSWPGWRQSRCSGNVVESVYNVWKIDSIGLNTSLREEYRGRSRQGRNSRIFGRGWDCTGRAGDRSAVRVLTCTRLPPTHPSSRSAARQHIRYRQELGSPSSRGRDTSPALGEAALSGWTGSPRLPVPFRREAYAIWSLACGG